MLMPPNFERLVLRCIKADFLFASQIKYSFCNISRDLQVLPTPAPVKACQLGNFIDIHLQYFANFAELLANSARCLSKSLFFAYILMKTYRNFTTFLDISYRRKHQMLLKFAELLPIKYPEIWSPGKKWGPLLLGWVLNTPTSAFEPT